MVKYELLKTGIHNSLLGFSWFQINVLGTFITFLPVSNKRAVGLVMLNEKFLEKLINVLVGIMPYPLECNPTLE